MDAATLQSRAPAPKRGQLTIFAGFFSGTGKTFAMLRAAARMRRAGWDVLIGCIHTAPWPETQALAADFESLPCKTVFSGGCRSEEFDLDTALERKPQLILLDDLSHQNLGKARNQKRFQDIDELLRAGIHVYTTLDIQHIEGLRDAVCTVWGRTEETRLPDSVFDRADRVEFIDIEPDEILERLSRRCGDHAMPPGAACMQLNAFREIGLRRCAERLSLCADIPQMESSQEHILVCISSEPSNAKVIKAAARMAKGQCCSLTALFVETKESQWMPQAEQEALRENIQLARSLGAAVERVYGEDVPGQIAEFSKSVKASEIVLGYDPPTGRRRLRSAALAERLTPLVPDIEVHAIPLPAPSAERRRSVIRWKSARLLSITALDFCKTVFLLFVTTLLGLIFYRLGFTEANIITIYILSVMLISVVTKSPICGFLSSISSVLIFNFFFTEPRFSLHAYDINYMVTFLVMLAVALITSSLATGLKSHAQRSAQMAWRAKLLLETSQSLQKAKDQTEILTVAANQLVKILQCDVVVYRMEDDVLSPPVFYPAHGETDGNPSRSTQAEREAAQWVGKNNQRAGAATGVFPDACYTYLPICVGQTVCGVIGIESTQKALDPFENSIALSVLSECTLALENQKNADEKEEAAVLAKNEQLRANLLRSISHDLRTPLTSISGNASNLISNSQLFDEPAKQQMYADIYDDAMWLINLVENLLSVSRLDEGRMNLHLSTELMDEVVAEALRHVNRKSSEYHLCVHGGSDEYSLVRIDARLIVQVLINIVDNAIKYTPPGSDIQIEWKRQGSFVFVSVADSGDGIPDHEKAHVFDMFYSTSNRVADSRRSMGLGLALCKSIINAHGGTISVSDNQPHGAIFTFSVPAGEVDLHE